jgi:flagellar protein FliL
VSGKPKVADTVESDDSGKTPAKSKKMLIVIVGLIFLLVLVGGGAAYIIKKRAAADDVAEGADSPSKAAEHAAPRSPPVYLPLDNMVVNLADPGGERVAQVGVIMEVRNSHASDEVKAYLPTIRSGVLMLISQRTSEELLKSEGKEKLIKDILRETSLPFGGGNDGHGEVSESNKKSQTKKKIAPTEYPVVGVLFSSFIIQ